MRLLLAFVLLGSTACAATQPAPSATPAPAPTATPTGATVAETTPARATSASATAGSVGVLVMAHGGSPEWNASVTRAVAELREELPTAVAYGMAHPRTLGAALDSLRDRGVNRVAVVRMFLSGDSFLQQTGWYLGFEDAPPEQFVLMNHGGHDHHPPTRDPLEHDLEVATHADGLLDAPETGRILAARARELSVTPSAESVLLLAHGAGDDAENAGLLARIDGYAEAIRAEGFAEVKAATLREDWPEARERAEAELLEWTDRQLAAGTDLLVIPVRLSGFGPYAEVLGDRPYRAGEGLLPHDIVAEWVSSTANRVACGAGWGPLTAPRCGSATLVATEVLQTPESPERR